MYARAHVLLGPASLRTIGTVVPGRLLSLQCLAGRVAVRFGRVPGTHRRGAGPLPAARFGDVREPRRHAEEDRAVVVVERPRQLGLHADDKLVAEAAAERVQPLEARHGHPGSAPMSPSPRRLLSELRHKGWALQL